MFYLAIDSSIHLYDIFVVFDFFFVLELLVFLPQPLQL